MGSSDDLLREFTNVTAHKIDDLVYLKGKNVLGDEVAEELNHLIAEGELFHGLRERRSQFYQLTISDMIYLDDMREILQDARLLTGPYGRPVTLLVKKKRGKVVINGDELLVEENNSSYANDAGNIHDPKFHYGPDVF